MQKSFIILLFVLYLVNTQTKPNPLPNPLTGSTSANVPSDLDPLELHYVERAIIDKSALDFNGRQKYDLANKLWDSQYILGFGNCGICKSIKYFAFKQGTNYVTAGLTQLTLAPPLLGTSGPGTAQLFQGIQNFDGTWSFKEYNGRYIRADNDLVTLDYQGYIGPWQRFYVERHGDHVHIQSAVWYRIWWSTSGGVLGQSTGASQFVIQWYPDLKWLWN